MPTTQLYMCQCKNLTKLKEWRIYNDASSRCTSGLLRTDWHLTQIRRMLSASAQYGSIEPRPKLMESMLPVSTSNRPTSWRVSVSYWITDSTSFLTWKFVQKLILPHPSSTTHSTINQHWMCEWDCVQDYQHSLDYCNSSGQHISTKHSGPTTSSECCCQDRGLRRNAWSYLDASQSSALASHQTSYHFQTVHNLEQSNSTSWTGLPCRTFSQQTLHKKFPFIQHDLLTVPRTRTITLDRAFSCAAPAAWNNISVFTKSADSLNTLKSRLKTELFRSAYWQYSFFASDSFAILGWQLQLTSWIN